MVEPNVTECWKVEPAPVLERNWACLYFQANQSACKGDSGTPVMVKSTNDRFKKFDNNLHFFVVLYFLKTIISDGLLQGYW